MFESALGNLCIVICGMTVLLSAFFIWRAETLPTGWSSLLRRRSC